MLSAAGAQEIPQINANGIIPNRSDYSGPMTPGIEVSVYGQQLGPKARCTAAGNGWPERKELCGTTVTVGGRPATLLYVQEQQINLRVPYDVPTEGKIVFIVSRNGRASRAAVVHFSAYVATIRHAGIAYIDMPIWIEVELPDPLRRSLRYPVTSRPTDFGGHQFEVRRNGVPLPPLSLRECFPVACCGPGTFGTVGSGGLIGLPHEPKDPRRLPLHLAYRFDKPGRYEVRYVGYDFRYPMQKHVLVRSSWIGIRGRPLSPGKRQAWLDSLRAAEPGDPVDWVSDFLPSLLAVPDAAALSLLMPGLYHPADLVRGYALNALQLFDGGALAASIPETIKKRGPTPEVAYALSWMRTIFQPRGSEIARVVLPYLKSTSSLLTAGALQTLYFMKPQYNWKNDPELPGVMDRAVAGQADRIIQTHDAAVLQPLALYLGTWKSETSRRLLRRLVAEGTVREQAEICLRWIGGGAVH